MSAVPTEENLHVLRESAQASLLRQWAGGQSLTQEQMSQVSAVVPVRLLVTPPVPRMEYKHDQAYYAEFYGCYIRTIKNYVRLGKTARRPCPLDDPLAMPGWWDELKLAGFIKQRISQHILTAAAKAQQSARADSPPVAPQTAPAGAPAPLPPGAPPPSTKIDVDELTGVGLSEAVKELSLQLAADQQELRKARADGLGEITVTRRLKEYNTTLESLRKTEESLLKLQAARGDLVSLSGVRSDLLTLVTTLRGMKRKLAANVCDAVAALLTPEQLAAVRAAIEVEARREETLLRTAKQWRRNPDGSVVA